MSYNEELSLALRVCQQAGDIALKYWQSQDLNVDRKADNTEVTQADRECERLLREEINKAYPNDGYLGEEEGETIIKAGKRRWIIDPIDGTFNYAKGLPIFSTLLALEDDGEIVLGVMHAPAMQETFWAEKSKGAFRNGKQIHISNCAKLSDALLTAGSLSRILSLGYWPAFTELVKKTYRQKAPGDYLNFAWVFEGKADIALEMDVKPWDLAPMKILAEESGGVYCDLAGGRSIYTGSCIVTTKALEQEVLTLISSFAQSK